MKIIIKNPYKSMKTASLSLIKPELYLGYTPIKTSHNYLEKI